MVTSDPSCSALEVRLVLVDRPHIRVGARPDMLGTGTAAKPRGDLGRPVEALALDDPVAGELKGAKTRSASA